MKLEDFLEKAQASGQFESTSDFTINTLKARHKLAASQLPQEGLWLVKLIQAAVSCGAKKAEIQFGKREVQFHFEVEDWAWEPRKLLHDLLSGVLPSDTTLFHLFAGLRNSLFEDTVRAEWRIATRDKLFRARFDESGTKVDEEPNPGANGFWLTTSRPPRWPGFKKAAHTPVKHLVRRTADEYMAIQNYCWTCPIPLYLDGRRLENRYVPSLDFHEDRMLHRALAVQHVGSYKVRPVLLVKRGLAGAPNLTIPWEDDGGAKTDVDFQGHTVQLKKRAYFGQTWMDWADPPAEDIGAYLILVFGAQFDSRIEFVCDGVVVSYEELPWSSGKLKVFGADMPANQFKVSVKLLVSVPAGELDLSHFNVREKSLYLDKWEAAAREATIEACEAVLANSRKFWPEMTQEPKNIASKALSNYFRVLMAVHPVAAYLRTRGFRKDIQNLLDSVQSEP